jgi:hypothetical protein
MCRESLASQDEEGQGLPSEGDLVEAEDHYSRALSLDSDHKPARQGRATALASMGLIVEALGDVR